MTAKPKRKLQPLVRILPEAIGRALQQAWLAHDHDEIARITADAKVSHPDLFRNESDGRFPDLGGRVSK